MYHLKKLPPVLAVLLIGLTAAYAQRGDTSKTLKIDIDLALVNASVTNVDGQVVTDLRRENFQLFEDNVEQEIRYFSTETTPVSLGIIFDASHSMEGKIGLATKAAVTFLENGTPEDEYFLVEF